MENKIPLWTTLNSVTKESVNKGKECWYKDEKHFLVYEADTFKLISKDENLTKIFCVPSNQISYVRKNN
jgi:hypothetical protein